MTKGMKRGFSLGLDRARAGAVALPASASLPSCLRLLRALKASQWAKLRLGKNSDRIGPPENVTADGP